MIQKLNIKTPHIISLAFAISGLLCSISPLQASAAVTGFHAGNIMNDVVATNYRSMGKNNIQLFLNAKGVNCTSGSNCLKNYVQGGKSAAQIIYETAQTYKINPQLLIVLLQKETGLVTINNPASWRYRTATGYGCPDTAACDSQYYGFTNQLKWSATMFRAILNDSPTWYTPYTVGSNRVYFHPDLGRCGSSIINIQNRTTAALYSYTPYQPNSASLAAGYGEGDSCSSYGNRNFFLYFTEWFGSTYVPVLFKTTTSDQAYLLNGNKYFRINSSSILAAYGFSKSEIGTVTPNMLGLYQDGGTLKNITRIDGSAAIYLVDHGKLLQFPSRDVYSAYGYTIGNEQDLDSLILDETGMGPALTDIVLANGHPEVYLQTGGKKRHISSPEAYNTMGNPLYSSRTTTALSQTYINSIPLGAPIIISGSLVKSSSTNKIYFWDGAGLQTINNQTAASLDIGIEYISSAIEQLPASGRPTINLLARNTDDKLYIFSGKRKFEIQPADVANLGFVANDFVTLPSGFISKINVPTSQFSGVFRINNSSAVYVIRSGERYHIASSAALSEQGFSFSEVVNLDTRSSGLFPDSGKKILSIGQLFRIGSSDSVYIVNSNSSSLAVPSPKLISAYGLSIDDVQSYTTTQASLYPNSGNLKYFTKDSLNNVWQIDNNGQKRSVEAGISGSSVFNINISSLPTLSDILLTRLTTRSALTNLVMASGQEQVYKIENGNKRWVTSRPAFDSLGLSYSNVRIVSDGFLASIPTGQPLR